MNTPTLVVACVLVLASAVAPARAQPAASPPPPAPPATAPAAPAVEETPPPTPATPAPTTAVAAIERANAAYEYGDMKEVVESARPIVDGAIEATLTERLQALRLLGIGLYLTGRPTGAEVAFLELLRNRPKVRLDPTTTRPDVVVFFEDVRRRHRPAIEEAARSRSRKSMVWNFLPPIGQFKNGDPGRGALFLTLEVASLTAAITTKLILDDWCPRGTGNICPGHNTDTAKTIQTWNFISVGVLAASYTAGVIDAFLRSDREPEEAERPVSFFIFPGGAGLSGTF